MRLKNEDLIPHAPARTVMNLYIAVTGNTWFNNPGYKQDVDEVNRWTDNALDLPGLRYFQVDLFRHERYQERADSSVKSHYWRDNLNVAFTIIRYVDLRISEKFFLIIH